MKKEWFVAIHKVSKEKVLVDYLSDSFDVIETIGLVTADHLKPIRKKIKKYNAQIKAVQQRQTEFNGIAIRLKALKVEEHTFMSIDVEAFEENHSCILEVGVSKFVDSKLSTKHFVIKEYLHLCNGKYVPDYRSSFQFGTSDVISLEEMKRKLAKELLDCTVLVLHDGAADIKLLRSSGVDISKINSMPLFDTNQLFKIVCNWQHPKASLSNVLKCLEIDHNYLHNAGNDSHHTLQAFMEMMKRLSTLKTQ